MHVKDILPWPVLIYTVSCFHNLTTEKKKDIPLAGEVPFPRFGIHILMWSFVYANTTPPNGLLELV
jgi:hypothetical protein